MEGCHDSHVCKTNNTLTMRVLYVFLFICILNISTVCFAKQFIIKDLSNRYSARIDVKDCDTTSCSGPAQIQLRDKNGKCIQRFKSQYIIIYLDKTKQFIIPYNDQSILVVDDFNFDGSIDLAIRNGNNSGYGGPSYDVYVYNITRSKFVRSDDLTELATTKLGMFAVDHMRKRLITLEKSGCCWHLTTEYEVIPKHGLRAVCKKEEDATGDDEYVKVTISRLVDGKWRQKTNKYKIDSYYK